VKIQGDAIRQHRESGGLYYWRWRAAGVSLLLIVLVLPIPVGRTLSAAKLPRALG